jgi:hypothetical protein
VQVIELLIDPTNPAILYAGTAGDGALKTTDGGTSWVHINNGLNAPSVRGLSLDRNAPSHIDAGTSLGAFISVDGGGQWSRITTQGLPDFTMWAIVVSPTAPPTIYAGLSDGGVFDIQLYPYQTYLPFLSRLSVTR